MVAAKKNGRELCGICEYERTEGGISVENVHKNIREDNIGTNNKECRKKMMKRMKRELDE